MAFGIVFTHDTYTFYKDQFSHEVFIVFCNCDCDSQNIFID